MSSVDAKALAQQVGKVVLLRVASPLVAGEQPDIDDGIDACLLNRLDKVR